MRLRNYQNNVNSGIIAAWNSGYRNVAAIMPTGAGKTHTKSGLIKQMELPTMCLAHRQELILQISESLAAWGIQHKIIAPNPVIKFATARHIQRFGQAFTHGNDVMLSSVQTLIRREDKYKHLFGRVKLWDIDECHHVLPDNQWGKATQFFPNALGLGVTATPERCDGKALNGIFETMVVGPTMRDLIDMGFLTDYRIFCPPQSIDLANVRVSQASGEYVQKELIDAAHESTIVGDVVQNYLRIAPGKRGLVFAVDRKSAKEMADAYNAAGVPARYVDGTTPDKERVDALDALARGDIKVITNVDLFGEGMDCPALDVVQMARPTQSYGLYVQQFGRALRTHDEKDVAIIIDHVSNVITHGLPDRPKQWSLEGRSSRPRDPDLIAMTACGACMQPREAFIKVCPFCGHQNVPQARSAPEHVDGDLIELDPAVLQQMRAAVINVDAGQPAIPYGASEAIVGRKVREWGELCEAQTMLRDKIAFWAGMYKYGEGYDDSMIHRRFYLEFGVDVMTAQSLRRADAVKLANKISEKLT